jgi:hypothetical protein
VDFRGNEPIAARPARRDGVSSYLRRLSPLTARLRAAVEVSMLVALLPPGR